LSEAVNLTVDDLNSWRSSNNTVVRRSYVGESRLYNLTFRLKVVHLPDNRHLNGHNTTSLLAHPLNPRCLILLTHHPTVSSMISPPGRSQVSRIRMVLFTIHRQPLNFQRLRDHPDRRVRITSRASRLAWRTLRGKSCQLLCESTR
jgi:hypothetical protein